MKNKKLLITICALAVVAVVAGIAACAPKANTNAYGNPMVNVQQADISPTPDKFGVVKADQWKDAYPYEYMSYLSNASNTPPAADYLNTSDDAWRAEGATKEDTTSTLPEDWEYVDAGKLDYLETNPEIKTLGKGYGYAKYYTEPASHVFSLWSVSHNGRVNDGTKTKAACITCKSPQYSNLVDMEGEEVHLRPFNEVIGQLDENISCASCHANTPMKDGKVYLEVDRAEWVRSMGADAGKTIEGEVCGQCHCDYSMAPGTSIPTSPYDNGRSDMVPEKAASVIDKTNFVFLMAPVYHSAMRFAGPVRGVLGVKTIMNLLGPLTNPAEAKYLMLGVYSTTVLEPFTKAAKALGAKRVMVAISDDGYDEISPCVPTTIAEILEDGEYRTYRIDPKDFGIPSVDPEDLAGGTGVDNFNLALDVLNGKGRPGIKYACALNAGAALYISKKAASIKEGFDKAMKAMEDGSVLKKIEEVKVATNS